MHLDRPFTGQGLTPERRSLRREEVFSSLDRALRIAGERGARFVLVAGDLFEARHVRERTLARLAEALDATGLPVLIAPGNHDALVAGSPYLVRPWPRNVHVFGPDPTPLRLDNVTIWGAGLVSGRDRRERLQGFQAPRDGTRHLFLLHGSASGGGEATTRRVAPFSPADVRDARLSYLALGHLHRFLVLSRRDGDVVGAYPGPPESISFSMANANHGVLWGTMGATGAVQLELIAVGHRRHRSLVLDVTAATDPDAVADLILQRVPADEAARDLYRITLVGRAPAEAADRQEIERALLDRFFAVRIRSLAR